MALKQFENLPKILEKFLLKEGTFINLEVLSMLEMAKQKVTLEMIHKDMLRIDKKLQILIDDEGELSDYAKRELKKARATPRSKYISNEELRRKLLK